MCIFTEVIAKMKMGITEVFLYINPCFTYLLTYLSAFRNTLIIIHKVG